MAMMAMTTRSSIKVKARLPEREGKAVPACRFMAAPSAND
jgi:hypothetical protein